MLFIDIKQYDEFYANLSLWKTVRLCIENWIVSDLTNCWRFLGGISASRTVFTCNELTCMQKHLGGKSLYLWCHYGQLKTRKLYPDKKPVTHKKTFDKIAIKREKTRNDIFLVSLIIKTQIIIFQHEYNPFTKKKN